jgi:uncharacterized repeat protein (TIGR01451 family)
VPGGGSFTLAIEAVGIPGGGYIGAQTFVVFGPDLSYNIAGAAPDEFVWPDCQDLTVVRAQFTSEAVNHGCLSGLINPPVSTFIGNLVELSFTCSTASSSTEIELLPIGDPLASSSGSGFAPSGGGSSIAAKVTNLIVDCIGPTPTPSDTPVPATNTPTVSPTPTDTPTPLPPPSERPDVKVTKIDLVDPVDSGATYTYRITVDSIGLQTADNVVVEDTLPDGSIFKSATSADADCDHNAGVVTCTVTNSMAPTDLITIDIQVNAPPLESDSLVDNLVTVTSSNEPFANTGNNKDIEQTFVLAPRSDVTLEKVSDPTFLDGGEDVTYTLIAKNLGPAPAENVKIVDTLPSNAVFVLATSPCETPVLGEVTCNVGSLAPNATTAVDIVLTAPLVTRSEFMKNTAVVSADNELSVQTGNNLAVANTAVVAPPPDLVVSKTDSDDPVLRLGFYSYEITIENQSLGDALDVVVIDTLPTASVVTFAKFLRSSTFISSVGAPCAPIGDEQIECTIDEINAGQQLIVTVNIRAPTTLEDQTITNNVSVSAADPDEIPTGNDASENTELKACYDVTGDLKVDLFNDIIGVINHHGLMTGEPGFDVIYDFDGGGKVDLFYDIIGVIDHHAQDCSLLI